jgi:hypothetical protein
MNAPLSARILDARATSTMCDNRQRLGCDGTTGGIDRSID